MGVTALFGGTFNPFHNGHLEILSALCEQDFIDEVFLLPDKIPPHKTCDFLASDRDRIAMCRMMCEKFDKAKLCLVEFEREGKSYTFDTVMQLKQLYKNKKFAVVCGGDMLHTLDSWYKFDLLKCEVQFIAFNRDNSSDFSADIERMRSLGADITVIDKNITSVSSTQIRENASAELLPEEIYRYIKEKGIYNG